MGPALPPTPPAQVLTLDYAGRLAEALNRGSAPTTLGDVVDLIGKVVDKRRDLRVDMLMRGNRVQIGPKTKGKRDASLRSRGNRRKAR